MSAEEDEHYWSKTDGPKRSVKKAYAGGKHVPNKNEAKLLRKIMAETGLSEEEVRQHKKYRKMLSEEQDRGEQQLSRVERFQKKKDRLLKKITKELKLAKEHPSVIAEFKKRWNNKTQTERYI